MTIRGMYLENKTGNIIIYSESGKHYLKDNEEFKDQCLAIMFQKVDDKYVIDEQGIQGIAGQIEYLSQLVDEREE